MAWKLSVAYNKALYGEWSEDDSSESFLKEIVLLENEKKVPMNVSHVAFLMFSL